MVVALIVGDFQRDRVLLLIDICMIFRLFDSGYPAEFGQAGATKSMGSTMAA